MEIEIDPELVQNKNKLNSVGEILNCIICSNILFHPLTCVYCENNFCKVCINKWQKNNNKCPLCNKELKTKESRIIKNLLSGLIIKCENCNKGINYDEYENHIISCKLPNNDFKVLYLKLKKDYDELNEKYKKLEKLFDINDENPNNIERIKKYRIKHRDHIHPLMKVLTERPAYACNNCRKIFEKVESYYCTVCDFDLCSECFHK